MALAWFCVHYRDLITAFMSYVSIAPPARLARRLRGLPPWQIVIDVGEWLWAMPWARDPPAWRALEDC